LSAVIDTTVFLRLAFEEPGWEHCGRLLDSVYSGEQKAVISAIQISELYTPFERAKDREGREKLAAVIERSRVKVVRVDDQIAGMSAQIRATEKTPKGNWLALADSMILATALTEQASTLYTLDMDFSRVSSRVKIVAPGMSLETWNETFGNQIRSKKRRQSRRA